MSQVAIRSNLVRGQNRTCEVFLLLPSNCVEYFGGLKFLAASVNLLYENTSRWHRKRAGSFAYRKATHRKTIVPYGQAGLVCLVAKTFEKKRVIPRKFSLRCSTQMVIMELHINWLCWKLTVAVKVSRQTCPSVSLCPLMHRIQLMNQMLHRALHFKVSADVLWRSLLLISLCLVGLLALCICQKELMFPCERVKIEEQSDDYSGRCETIVHIRVYKQNIPSLLSVVNCSWYHRNDCHACTFEIHLHQSLRSLFKLSIGMLCLACGLQAKNSVQPAETLWWG